MNIRTAQTSDALQLSSLILQAVYDIKDSDFDDEGWDRFSKAIEPEEIERRISSTDYQIFVAIIGSEIVGTISILQNEKIDQLFIANNYRRRGIASALWHHAKANADNNGGTGSFWVRSSTLGVPLYESFGFKKTGSRQKLKGISFQLLEYNEAE